MQFSIYARFDGNHIQNVDFVEFILQEATVRNKYNGELTIIHPHYVLRVCDVGLLLLYIPSDFANSAEEVEY